MKHPRGENPHDSCHVPNHRDWRVMGATDEEVPACDRAHFKLTDPDVEMRSLDDAQQLILRVRADRSNS